MLQYWIFYSFKALYVSIIWINSILREYYMTPSLNESLFPTLINFKMVLRNCTLLYFCGNFKHSKSRKSFGIFCIHGHMSNQTKVSGHMDTMVFQNMTSMWTFQIPTSLLERTHIDQWHGTCQNTTSYRYVSAWTDNDLKHIDPSQLCCIQILSMVLDHFMHLKQNTERLLYCIVLRPTKT